MKQQLPEDTIWHLALNGRKESERLINELKKLL